MNKQLLLQISELFYSIQGESTYAGLPCLFIRVAGCNLRCSYCDATYTYEEEGLSKSMEELLAFVDLHPHAIVEITGGEPLLQENIYPLMQALLARKRQVLLETNGTISLAKVPANIIKIMDVKCPGSTMQEKIDLGNLALLAEHDQLKFVLSSRKDYDWARMFISDHQLIDFPNILFSPVPDKLSAARLAEWILQDNMPVRLQLQLHKILWPTSTRGV